MKEQRESPPRPRRAKVVSGVYFCEELKLRRAMTLRELKRRRQRRGKDAQHWRRVRVGE